ncbi:hypothetical protein F3087_10450 [Nocardia colli]|uniref:DUF3558 domain-containing protein n=1 Tax=Nocardia colli TaxID=2545717 RepID=A0A5N0EIY1_9NOCA|nr:hypothetical protein [Nocardia colli]KAA8889347.1 hypothetical protein F3087_10450 [Nocardia colli]
MMGPAGQRPPSLSNAGWLHEPLTPIGAMRPYPDGRVPPQPLRRWKPPGGNRGRLWTLGALAGVSTLVVVAVLGVSDSHPAAPTPDLRGYHYVDNLCAITDTAPYLHAGFVLAPSSSATLRYPLHQTRLHPALDTMNCTIRLAPPGPSERADDTTLMVNAAVHKRADPAPEFTARFETWTQAELAEDDRVSKLDGIGDEAYLVRKETEHAQNTGVTLAIRDGWTTFEISWLHPPSVVTTTDIKVPEVVELLKHTAATTMALLRA